MRSLDQDSRCLGNLEVHVSATTPQHPPAAVRSSRVEAPEAKPKDNRHAGGQDPFATTRSGFPVEIEIADFQRDVGGCAKAPPSRRIARAVT